MNGKTLFTLTREKHLDHLVRVTPLIVLAYAVQGYVIMTVTTGGHSLVLSLGASLIGMILCFVAYDNFHRVDCFEGHIDVQWLLFHQQIKYSDILDVSVSDDSQSFSTVTLTLTRGKTRFYFVDDALEFKAFVDSKRTDQNEQLAA